MHAIHLVIIPSTSISRLVPLGIPSLMVTFPKASAHLCLLCSCYAVLSFGTRTLFLFHSPPDTFLCMYLWLPFALSLFCPSHFFSTPTFHEWFVILCALSFLRLTNSSDESRASSVLSVPSSAGALSVVGHTLETLKGLLLLLLFYNFRKFLFIEIQSEHIKQ